MIRERDIERFFVAGCRERGWLALKFVSPGLRGVPDRLVLKPGGVAEFVELKAPGKKATAAQLRFHEKLRALGFKVTVLNSRE